MELTLKEIIKAGGLVFVFLTLLSIYSIAIIIEKYKEFKKMVNHNLEIISKFNADLKTSRVEDAIKTTISKKGIVSEMVLAMINHRGTIREKREFVSSMVEYYTSILTKKLNTLATIGSTAPFIGLFGTVIGVIRAFKDMAVFQSAGPSVIAHGISEALVNTAMGLFVAIPAVVAYNYFVSKANKFATDLNWLIEQIIDRYYKNENP